MNDRKFEIMFIFSMIISFITSYLVLGVRGVALLILVVLTPLYLIRISIALFLREWEDSMRNENEIKYISILIMWYISLSILILFISDVLLSVIIYIPFVYRFIGLLLISAGIFIASWTVYRIGMKNIVRIPEVFSESYKQRLVRNGPYGIVRHPLYLSELCIIFGCFLISGEASLLILFLVWIPILAYIIRWEENNLMRIFGGKYLKYKKEVPTIIPRIRNKNVRKK